MSPFRRGRVARRRPTAQKATRAMSARSARPVTHATHAGPATEGGGDAAPPAVPDAFDGRAGRAPGAVHPPFAVPAATGAGLPGGARAGSVVELCRPGRHARRAVEPLSAGRVQGVCVAGGTRGRGDAGVPVVDSRGGKRTVA